MNADEKKKAKQRLARIEGQVRGISGMVEADNYCIDVVRQIQAAKAALTGLENHLLKNHLQTCMETALKSDNIEERREKVEELYAVLGGVKK